MKMLKFSALVSAVAMLAFSSIAAADGDDAARSLRSGNIGTSSVDCVVSDWTYSKCNKRTHTMQGTRTITASSVGNGAKCPDLSQSLPCYCETTDWLDASACDSSGYKTMTRTVKSLNTCTPADLTKQVTCTPTPMNCVYSYSTDAACNSDGSQTQTLVITTQAANGGTACPTDTTKNVAGVCSAINCVHTYTNDGTCKADGSQDQTLFVRIQAAYGGQACPTDTTKNVAGVCPPVNCVFTYSTDAACAADGSQLQTLSIKTPAAYGGTACPKKETRSVRHYCPPLDCVVSGWTYTSCKQVEGTSNYRGVRKRTIISEARYGGVSCNGFLMVQTVVQSGSSFCSSAA